ncbi:MAG: alpha/beta fold hydrolase, partial [Patescibacteria group bacterium]
MPFIELNDVKIFYVLHHNAGSKNIILIHGAGGNHLSMLSIFNYIKKKFGRTYNILILDLPFHFRSADFNSNHSISEKEGMQFYAETIYSLASKSFGKNEKALLIGHSMGAQICIKYACLFPEKVEKIMTIAGCHNTGISDSFIKSLENSFDRT